MQIQATLVSVFLVGLLGSLHCMAMCGGIVGALTLRLDGNIRQSPARLAPYLLAYNSGRIASYALAGALAGYLGGQAAQFFSPAHAHSYGRVISAAFMIALGLYLAGWAKILVQVERIGMPVWRRLEPIGRRFMPVRRPVQALALGAVWGWLPCGMVYAVLAWALATATPGHGALLMVAFGLGTLPMLLTLGAAAERLTRFTRHPAVRISAGVIIVLFGVTTLFAPGLLGGHVPMPGMAGMADAAHAMHHH